MTAVSAARSPAKLLTRDYVLVCLASGIVFSAYHFMLPTLPLFVKSIEGQNYDVGLVMGAFTISSVTCRLAVGRAVDLWGRKWILVGGTFMFSFGMLALALTTTVPSLLFVRVAQGVGFGAMTTATGALVADLAPIKRRAEAMGYYGMFNMVAMAVAPSVALSILGSDALPFGGFPLVFAVGALVAALSGLLTLFVSKPSRVPRAATATRTRLSLRDLLVPKALPLALTLVLAASSYGAMAAFLPLHAGAQNSRNVAIFFFIYGLVVVVARPMSGLMSDRFGHRRVLIPALGLTALSVSFLGLPADLPIMAAVAVLYGVGFGAIVPSLMALTLDLVPPERRGAAMATVMSAFDCGIAAGALTAGAVAQFVGYGATFPVAGGMAAMGLIYFLVYSRRSLAKQAARN